MNAAAVVLAGGASTRMGSAKASLEWHGSTLLRRVTGLVARAVDGPVVVVRAPGQALPSLPAVVEVVDDAVAGQGPLRGLATGLTAIGERADVVYLSSTDAPLLHPAFVRLVVRSLTDQYDAVVPETPGFAHPLAAAYRVALLPLIDELLAAGERRFSAAIDRCRVLSMTEQGLLGDPELARVDATLGSLLNVNDRSQYEAARALPAPEVTVCASHTPSRESDDSEQRVPAATLRMAAVAVAVELGPEVVALVNGREIPSDPELPLAHGDAVDFRVA